MSRQGAPERGVRSGNLQLRIVSALVLGAVVLAVAWVGGPAFRILAAIMAAAVFYEWRAMARRGEAGARDMAARLALVLVLAVLISGMGAAVCFAAAAVAVLACLVFDLVRRSGFWSSAGLAYAAVPAIAATFLRGADGPGLKAIVFLFVVVWATDILAYFVGRAVGGPKLAPSISPGKTWSGAIGGAAGGVIAALVFAMTAGSVPGPAAMAFVGLGLSVVSQLGDLFESAVKRRFGVKDSGTMIPGHGGMMDRVDGLVVAAVLFYLMGAVLSGADTPAHGFFA